MVSYNTFMSVKVKYEKIDYTSPITHITKGALLELSNLIDDVRVFIISDDDTINDEGKFYAHAIHTVSCNTDTGKRLYNINEVNVVPPNQRIEFFNTPSEAKAMIT